MPHAVRCTACSMQPAACAARLVEDSFGVVRDVVALEVDQHEMRKRAALEQSLADRACTARATLSLTTATTAVLATSAPGLGPPLPHLHWDCAQLCTARARSLPPTRHARSYNSARHSRMNTYGRLTARALRRSCRIAAPAALRQVSARAAQGLARRRGRRRCSCAAAPGAV